MTGNGRGFEPMADVTLGQSGAEVVVVEHFGRAAVLKRDTDPKRGARLERQLVKQRAFAVSQSFLRVPDLLSAWNGTEVVMEFVPGVLLGEFLATASSQMADTVRERLCGFLEEGFEQSEWSPGLTCAKPLVEKFESLFHAASDPIVQRTVSRAARAVLEMDHPLGRCHGDFSFENLIVVPRSHEVWAIDFLDAPLDSPLIDVGRLLIDIEHGWWKSSGRRSAGDLITSRSLSLCVRDLAARYGAGSRHIALYKVLAAARIIPYTASPVRKALLLNVLRHEERLLGE